MDHACPEVTVVEDAGDEEFDVEADAREHYTEIMGFNLPIEERRGQARAWR